MVRGGQRTFLGTTRIRSGEQEKIKQTNKHEQCLGLTKSRRRICNTTCMCRLTLAWVTSENFTSNSNADIFWLNLLCWTLSCLLLSQESTASVCGSMPTLPLTRLSAVSSPTALVRVTSSTLSRVPLPLPDTARFQFQKSFVWFRAETDKGIVCSGHPYSATLTGYFPIETNTYSRFGKSRCWNNGYEGQLYNFCMLTWLSFDLQHKLCEWHNRKCTCFQKKKKNRRRCPGRNAT